MFRRNFIRVGCLLFLFAVGCTPSQSDVEKSIRDEMKSGLGVMVQSLDVKKQSDGSYLGTATTENGDVYDVTTLPPKNGTVEWKAVPGQAMVEKMVREGLEKQLGSPVKTMTLTKNGPGTYSGPAELQNASKVNVTTKMEGTMFLWEALPIE
jgi:hypothetical protein